MAVFKCNGNKRFDEAGEPFCTYEAPRAWKGRCPECRRLYGYQKVGTDAKVSTRATFGTLGETKVKPRISTGVPEVDKVLNGGIPKGSTLIISGPSGMGKTTLLMSISDKVAKDARKVTYVSGEQSVDDLAEYAQRLGTTGNTNVYVIGNEGDIYKICNEAESNGSALLIIDSMQTSWCSDVGGDEGSAEQCKAIANYVTAWGKRTNIAVIMVAHCTKDGELAGPQVAVHLVDGTLEFDPCYEFEGDGKTPTAETIGWRKLTSGTKFRIGPSNVSEMFEMTLEGVIKPIKKKSILSLV